MSSGLILNHVSASGNASTQTITGHGAQSVLVVTGAAGFQVPLSAGAEAPFAWPGSDTNFYVAGRVAGDASATSFGTLGDYDIAVFGNNLQVSGTLSVAGSIRGGLEAKDASANPATPVANEVAFWTSNLFLSGTDKLRWDDSDLVVGGNVQIQGSTTTLSSSQVTFKDSIIGLGFTGSEGFGNTGQRGVLFAKGASASSLLPALSWDGTRAYTLAVPASPSSGTIDFTLGGNGLSGMIPIQSHAGSGLLSPSQVQAAYGGGSHVKALVFPVADNGVVAYPGISGSLFQIDDGTYVSTLYTDKWHDPGTQTLWGCDGADEMAVLHKNVLPSYGDEKKGKWNFYAGAGGSSQSARISSRPGALCFNAGSGIHLTASNSDVVVKVSSGGRIKPNYDNQCALGTAAIAWSDLFLGDGAVLGLNSDIVGDGASITHSTDTLTCSGTLGRNAGVYTVGTLAFFDSQGANGGSAFLQSSVDYTESSTSISFASGFSATDVTQMAAGNLIVLEESGIHYYYQISSQPSEGATSLSVAALGSGESNSSEFAAGTWTFTVDTYYAPQFATSFTSPIEYTLGADGTAWRVLYGNSLDMNGAITTGSIVLDADGDTAIGTSADDVIDWFIGDRSTSKFFMNASGLFPKADNSYDLGKAAKRYRNIYTCDVNLKNDRGDWTLIEENDFISFRNNETGRRYRMAMEEITGMGNYGPGNDGEM